MLRRRKNQTSPPPNADTHETWLPEPGDEEFVDEAPAVHEQPSPEEPPTERIPPNGEEATTTPDHAQTRQRGENSYRREDERRREEARTATLQSQVDELRALLRELSSRQLRADEQTKHHQSQVAQNALAIDQLRNDVEQNSQARSLDENRTRQKIDDLESRIDDGIRPIRSLQAHVTEILEDSRKKVDDTAQNEQRFDEITTIIEHLSALGDRTSALTHGLRDGIDNARTETDGLRRDIIRTEDAVKIVDQEARRRTADVQDVVDGYNSRIDELRADLAHLYDSLENTRRGLVHVDPTLDELRAAEETLRQEFTRFQAVAEERHDMVIDMQDDARQETDARFEQIRQNMEERVDRLNERIEESSEMHRDLSYKMGNLGTELEELRQLDAALHRDIWYLHEQRVRIRMEQIQEELDSATTQRRDAESDFQSGANPRARRRRVDVESDI